jgi:hypothetical protein
VNWSSRGKWEGSRDYVVDKGDPIPWVVQVEGKESWWIGIIVGVKNLGFGMVCMESGKLRGQDLLVES